MTNTAKNHGYFIRYYSVCFSLGLLLTGPSMAQPFFANASETAGIGGPIQPRTVAFNDYDNDGWPDLFMIQNNIENQGIFLWHNEGDGRFAERSALLEEEIMSERKGGGSIFGDFDRDGDLDLFMPRGFEPACCPGEWALNRLLRNDRGRFVDITSMAQLTDVLPTDNAIWLDYDRDGYLDLYAGHEACCDDPKVRNKLYRNNGDATFVDVTEAAGLLMPLGAIAVDGPL